MRLACYEKELRKLGQEECTQSEHLSNLHEFAHRPSMVDVISRVITLPKTSALIQHDWMRRRTAWRFGGLGSRPSHYPPANHGKRSRGPSGPRRNVRILSSRSFGNTAQYLLAHSKSKVNPLDNLGQLIRILL
jgi:hypothetical protein